jgi:hypothetical protein
MRALTQGVRDWPYIDELFGVDLELLTGWISGRSYVELGQLAPQFPRGLFAGDNDGERASDAAEYVNRLSYPASWTWSGALAIVGYRRR